MKSGIIATIIGALLATFSGPSYHAPRQQVASVAMATPAPAVTQTVPSAAVALIHPAATATPVAVQSPVIVRQLTTTIHDGIATSTFLSLLSDFESKFNAKLATLTSASSANIPQYVAAAGSGGYAASNAINQLTNTTINTPTITGGSLSGVNISGTVGGSLSGTALLTNATTTSLAITSIPWSMISTDGQATWSPLRPLAPFHSLQQV